MQRTCWKMVPKAGSIDNLTIVKEELIDPQPHEVQISVKAVGLNFADIFAMYGLYGATPEGAFVPGLEYAGTISKLGEEVKHLQEGQHVMGVTRFGGYASALNIDARYVVPLPDKWNFEEGAAYLVQVLTAYYGLVELGNIKNNSTVLIQSAAGGVGLWANRIAKNFNAYTIGCVGHESKLKLLESEGYDHGFVRDGNYRNNLKKAIQGRNLNLVMECIGGRVFLDSYLEMAPEGRLITYGSAHYGQTGARPNYIKLAWQYYNRPKLDTQKMIEQNKAVMGFNLIYLFSQADKMHRMLGELQHLKLGKPYVGHSFPFTEIRTAISRFQTGETSGKLVAVLDQE